MAEKHLSLRAFYQEIAGSYELVNHLFSWGLDRRWRKKAVGLLRGAGKEVWLDVCTGTGEFATGLKLSAGSGTRVYGLDYSREMLLLARNKPGAGEVRFIESSAYTLPFSDNSFDVLTVSFALRNLKTASGDFQSCFREFRRVLKPGGVFLNLETSQPKSRIIRRLFHAYVMFSVPRIGGRLSGNHKAYRYLSGSVKNFLPAGKLAEVIRGAGFSEVSFEQYLFGVIAVHKAVK